MQKPAESTPRKSSWKKTVPVYCTIIGEEKSISDTVLIWYDPRNKHYFHQCLRMNKQGSHQHVRIPRELHMRLD